MAKIKNITIEFHCLESLDDALFCDKCSRRVIDFTNKTDSELRKEIENSNRTVCGLFKKSQLSNQFLKYAAATFIATSLTVPAIGQEVIKGDSIAESVLKKSKQKPKTKFFLG